ncbi:MAG: HPr kinase/phosphorylase [Paracoccaceae bacterium]
MSEEITESAGPDGITMHGSAVALRDQGLLITGEPGAGKTSLAVEMMALGAELIADDWVQIERGRAVGLVISAPKPIAGLVELRGIGLIRLPHMDQAPLTCIVDMNRSTRDRLPMPHRRTLLGVACPVVSGAERPGLAAAMMAVLRAGGLLDPDVFATV